MEYSSLVAGPWCARLLAGLGAEVIKVERPGRGDESRLKGPFPGDIPNPEKSGLVLYVNMSKLGVTLDVKTKTGQKLFKQLVARSDILIEDQSPGTRLVRGGRDVHPEVAWIVEGELQAGHHKPDTHLTGQSHHRNYGH